MPEPSALLINRKCLSPATEPLRLPGTLATEPLRLPGTLRLPLRKEYVNRVIKELQVASGFGGLTVESQNGTVPRAVEIDED